jgi:mRNA-degrading endonuclease RelE of RelBE toxin-antitoxin system
MTARDGLFHSLGARPPRKASVSCGGTVGQGAGKQAWDRRVCASDGNLSAGDVAIIQRAVRRPAARIESQSSITMFSIEFNEDVAQDLAELRAFDRKRILDEIDSQLTHQPTQETRHRKKLVGLVPPWEHAGPVWELRIGEFRVFYAVDEEQSQVVVRAIRLKPPHKTTEEIL